MSRLLYWGIYVPVAIYIGFYLLHVFSFGGGRCKSKARMDGKTVIVTGSNSGIGKETALKLAQRGARVIMACRSRDRTQPAIDEIISKTGNKMIVFMELDLSSFQSVEKFAKSFSDHEDRLDVLINNAGMMSKEHRLTKQGLEMTLMTNYFGHFLLTNLLLDKLKKSGPGTRIVNVASVFYMFANPAAFHHLDDLILDGTKNLPKIPNEIPFQYKVLKNMMMMHPSLYSGFTILDTDHPPSFHHDLISS